MKSNVWEIEKAQSAKNTEGDKENKASKEAIVMGVAGGMEITLKKIKGSGEHTEKKANKENDEPYINEENRENTGKQCK